MRPPQAAGYGPSVFWQRVDVRGKLWGGDQSLDITKVQARDDEGLEQDSETKAGRISKYLQGKLGYEEGDSVVTGSLWIW